MRNADPFIREALESVLGQEGVDLEVIVVDDGSTDRSVEIVREVNDNRVRIVTGPCLGISMSVNTGLKEVRGEIVVRCDADDLYPPGRLSWQLQWLADHPDFGAVCGRFSSIDEQGRPLADLNSGETAEEITEELQKGITRTHLCTYAVRTELLQKIGGCRQWFRTAEDIDLQLRLAEAGRVWYEPKTCYQYRLHGTSITHTDTNALRRFYEATARDFAAQRRTGKQDELEQGKPPPVVVLSQTGSVHNIAKHMQGMLLGQAWAEHSRGEKLMAIRLGWRACWESPRQFAVWKSLVALLLKPAPRRP
jgi:glycosyltransferase involved in cell wall biosynthesis